ncbi:MFS transporter [uncultured Leclercia sp.]|uniref:MFS transporter n=1 Tax=uncultured Leclercia sp. TaxID=332959 RepID=UPI0025940EBC|nr:MFS transporter [uncultured Leclercia sp.]
MTGNTTEAEKTLPVLRILALTLTGFIAIMTETMPVGLIGQISTGLNISTSMAGQLVSVYAAGSFLSAIPVIAATRSINRRALLLVAVAGFLIMNLITALSSAYAVILAARFGAGIAAGIAWGLLTGFTVRMVSEGQQGKALALMGVGQPVALAIGVPATVWLSAWFEWQTLFLLVSAVSLLLFFWVRFALPSIPGEAKAAQKNLSTILLNSRIISVLVVLFFWVGAHNLMYTFISPLLSSASLSEQLDLILLTFGISSVAGIILTGLYADRFTRGVTLLALSLFTVSGMAMMGAAHNLLVYTGAAMLWGLGFGGAPTLLLKYLAGFAGKDIDVAQSGFVTVFNMAVAGGAAAGGAILSLAGAGAVPLSFTCCAVLALLIFRLRIAGMH